MKKKNCVDYSNGADDILVIQHHTKAMINEVIFNATEEDNISEWITNNIGEQINEINGCSIFTEVSSWASLYAGEDELKYTLDNYPELDDSEWTIELFTR